MKTNFYKIIMVGLLVLTILLFQSHWYLLKTNPQISVAQEKKLYDLGQKALQTQDVPVAALLFYKGQIIGEGYNTVLRDSNLAGHAEVNAINMAYRQYKGGFYSLDRKDLVMYSTFEPCEMCKGMMLHYKIYQAYFEQDKKSGEQIGSTLKSLRYEWNKKQFFAHRLQERLFMQHPQYKAQKFKK